MEGDTLALLTTTQPINVAIVAKMNNHKQNARDDIQAAMDSLDLYIAEVSAVVQLAGIVTENFRRTRDKLSTKVRKKKCLIF